MSRATPPESRREPEIRILIADDHAVVRDGLRALIQAQPGFEVVGEAANGEEAWQQACELRPDVLLLDLWMPVLTGAEAAELVVRDCPEVRILVLTMHEERGYVARLMGLGAAGYVLKRAATADLVYAIRAVAAGRTYIDSSLSGERVASPGDHTGVAADAASAAGAAEVTTKEEEEVLRLVARGHTNKEIAAARALSVKDVETHKASGMAKLGVESRAALVRYALAAGWPVEG